MHRFSLSLSLEKAIAQIIWEKILKILEHLTPNIFLGIYENSSMIFKTVHPAVFLKVWDGTIERQKSYNKKWESLCNFKTSDGTEILQFFYILQLYKFYKCGQDKHFCIPAKFL